MELMMTIKPKSKKSESKPESKLMKFLDLPLGARFRYQNLDVLFVKLSDFNYRDEKIGLVTRIDPTYFYSNAKWHGQQVMCAEDTEEKCEALIVEFII